MSAFVVDASVGVKWVVPESHADSAERLRGSGLDLHVPALFDVEVGNVLWKKVRRGELTGAEALRAAAIVEGAPLIRHTDPALAREALQLAVSTGRTVYDAVYLALAVRLDLRVVTADEKFRNALLGTEWERFVGWVADVP